MPDEFSARPPSATQGEILVRIDERTNVLLQELRLIKETTVTKAEFTPVRSLVYGLVGLIMSGVIIAMLSLLISTK